MSLTAMERAGRGWPAGAAAHAAHAAARVCAGAVLLALSSQVSIPLPGTPVPATLQTLGLLIVSIALGRRLGTAAVSLFLAAGFAGAPVFASGAGPLLLLRPTAGYLLAFLFVPGLIGHLLDGGPPRVARTALAASAALAMVLLLGTLGLGLSLGLDPLTAVWLGTLPFVPIEAAKALLAALLVRGPRAV